MGKNYDLARQMCNYWAEFMKNGNPNGMDSDSKPMERWEAYTDEEPNIMTFYESPKAQCIPAGELLEFLMGE